MRKTDASDAKIADIRAAFGLLTRLPVAPVPPRGARPVWAYPLAGLAVGLLAGTIGAIALWCGLPPALAAALALAAQIGLTGALHEDGVADTADGLWGGSAPARRLEIMKDSHIGTFGTLALILSVQIRWAALWLLFGMGGGWGLTAMMAAAALSRAVMPLLMRVLPAARASGLSQSVGRPDWRAVGTGAALAGLAAMVLLGWSAFAATICALLAGGVIGWIARAKIGGQTGDILGAAQQIAEIAVLMSIIA